MDFTTRQPVSPNTNRFAPAGEHAEPEKEVKNVPKTPKSGGIKHKQAWAQGVAMFFLLCLVALAVAVLLFIASNNRSHEAKYVNTKDYQAVEVASNNSQPTYYFGNIAVIDDNYLVLNNAYTSSANTTGTNPVSATPLACSSENGSSQLILNRAQVVLWDNLAPSSDAVKAIQLYNQTYPNGQCSQSAQSTGNTEQPASTSDQTSPTSNSLENQTGNSTGTAQSSGGATTGAASSPTSTTSGNTSSATNGTVKP
ncbi:MAG: hypothetical protein ACREHG_01570 [Candidatus Saccharimonadales bacterium]